MVPFLIIGRIILQLAILLAIYTQKGTSKLLGYKCYHSNCFSIAKYDMGVGPMY